MRTNIPVPGVGQIDTIVSAAVFAWCAASVMKIVPQTPPWLVALWAGLTVLTHFDTFVPGSVQLKSFTLLAVLPAAYTLLWAAEPLNDAAKRSPFQAIVALDLMSILMILVCAIVWINDRFGRENDVFITTGGTYQTYTRMTLGMPLLAVLIWVFFVKHSKKKPGSMANGRLGASSRRNPRKEAVIGS